MDNQDNNQINNTQPSIPTGADQGVNQTPESPPIGVPTADVPVGSTPTENVNPAPPAKRTGKLMFLIIGAVLVLAIILLVMIFSGALNKSAKPVSIPQVQQIITPTPGDQDQGVSQTPITNQQDVTNALGELDKANPDTVGADLGQNTADASSFSQ